MRGNSCLTRRRATSGQCLRVPNFVPPACMNIIAGEGLARERERGVSETPGGMMRRVSFGVDRPAGALKREKSTRSFRFLVPSFVFVVSLEKVYMMEWL